MATPQIVDGPSKYDLSLALFDRTCDKPRPVRFKIRRKPGFDPVEVMMHVVSVGIKDGSGESWIIEVQTADFSRYYHGYYSTQNRTGGLKPGLHHES